MPDHFIAFWNVENLFDRSTSSDRPEYLRKQLRKELTGWTASVVRQKIAQLVKIIEPMNEGLGPDILGVCEIENETVVQQLISALPASGRDYQVAHADTQDQRGIDCAVIYDANKYTAGLQFNHFVQKRSATRDIFQVNLTTAANQTLVVICNHWPSRSGGQYKSEPYRMMVGETLAYFHKRILEELGQNTAVVAMGDFNDEPFDRSIREYAQVSRNRQKIMNATSVDYFYNLMWELLGARMASYYFGSVPNMLDQFWVSKGILKSNTPFSVKPGSVTVYNPAELIASGDYPRARKFGRPSKPSDFDDQGYSDHFPITMTLEEKVPPL